jgi:hypothetical protein
MSHNPQALEKSLFKVFEISVEAFADKIEFNNRVSPFFQKASAVKAMRQYLKGDQQCPRILGILLYSDHGNAEIRNWVSKGMPIELLYKCMLFDGGYLAQLGLELPLAHDIETGDTAWDFDYKLLNGLQIDSAVPGLVEAVLKRAIYKGGEAALVQALNLATLTAFIEQHGEILRPLIARCTPANMAPNDTFKTVDIALEAIRSYLPPLDAIHKMLHQPRL